MSISQWMYFTIYMPSWCNAVGVELFLRKHGYSEEVHGGLRLESVTPMVLKHISRNMNYVISHLDS